MIKVDKYNDLFFFVRNVKIKENRKVYTINREKN